MIRPCLNTYFDNADANIFGSLPSFAPSFPSVSLLLLLKGAIHHHCASNHSVLVFPFSTKCDTTYNHFRSQVRTRLQISKPLYGNTSLLKLQHTAPRMTLNTPPFGISHPPISPPFSKPFSRIPNSPIPGLINRLIRCERETSRSEKYVELDLCRL